MRSGSGRHLQVTMQDWSAFARWNIVKLHDFPTAMTQHSVTARRTHIEYPVRLRSQHCDEVALRADVGDHHWELDHAAASPAPDLQHGCTIREQPRREHGSGCAVL